jgi:hypothetical protein
MGFEVDYFLPCRLVSCIAITLTLYCCTGGTSSFIVPGLNILLKLQVPKPNSLARISAPFDSHFRALIEVSYEGIAFYQCHHL